MSFLYVTTIKPLVEAGSFGQEANIFSPQPLLTWLLVANLAKNTLFSGGEYLLQFVLPQKLQFLLSQTL